jgi:hypothetical protein
MFISDEKQRSGKHYCQNHPLISSYSLLDYYRAHRAQEGIACPRSRQAYAPHRKQACFLSFAHRYLGTTSQSIALKRPSSPPSRELTITRTISDTVESLPDSSARSSPRGQFLRRIVCTAPPPLLFYAFSTDLRQQETLPILVLSLLRLVSRSDNSSDCALRQAHRHEIWKWKAPTPFWYQFYTPGAPTSSILRTQTLTDSHLDFESTHLCFNESTHLGYKRSLHLHSNQPPLNTVIMPPKSLNHLKPKTVEKPKQASTNTTKHTRRNINASAVFPVSKPNKTFLQNFKAKDFPTMPTPFTSLSGTGVDSAQPQLNLLLQYNKKHASLYPIFPTPGSADHYEYHQQAVFSLFTKDPNTACANRPQLQFIVGRMSLTNPKLIIPELNSTMKITSPNRTCKAYAACLMVMGSNYDPTNQQRITTHFKSNPASTTAATGTLPSSVPTTSTATLPASTNTTIPPIADTREVATVIAVTPVAAVPAAPNPSPPSLTTMDIEDPPFIEVTPPNHRSKAPAIPPRLYTIRVRYRLTIPVKNITLVPPPSAKAELHTIRTTIFKDLRTQDPSVILIPWAIGSKAKAITDVSDLPLLNDKSPWKTYYFGGTSNPAYSKNAWFQLQWAFNDAFTKFASDKSPDSHWYETEKHGAYPCVLNDSDDEVEI